MRKNVPPPSTARVKCEAAEDVFDRTISLIDCARFGCGCQYRAGTDAQFLDQTQIQRHTSLFLPSHGHVILGQLTYANKLIMFAL